MLALLLAACGGGEATPPLNGVIIDAYTQKPVAGATVSVGETTVTTDAAGAWSVANWDSTNRVDVQATDYATATLALADKKPVNPTTPVTVSLTVRPNTLSGKLLDAYTQQPVAGALIQTSTGISATSSPEGAYKLVGVTESFSVTVSATDYGLVSSPIERNTAYDATLRPTVLSGVLIDKYSQKPIAGATVSVGALSAATDAEGRYTLRGVEPKQELLISATDYTTQTLEVPAATTLDAVLRPSTVRGTVLDAETGQPLSKGAVIAMPAPSASADPTKPFTGTAVALTRLSEDGTYVLNDVPEGAQVQVMAPGYRKNWTTVSEGNFTADLKVEPFVAKAVYITAATGSSKEALSELFDMVDQTELNAVVLDIKLDFVGNVGGVGYLSNHPLVLEAGTSED
ncbi:MAG TPA: carboxypeptidase regulatory-like domain-containing protein, partial [Herpetosiphonaceae bacterium]|nr:carboxypeptidase regulatory-like domain-containing protein [Herpetosiphonaceae bacterium]